MSHKMRSDNVGIPEGKSFWRKAFRRATELARSTDLSIASSGVKPVRAALSTFHKSVLCQPSNFGIPEVLAIPVSSSWVMA